MSQAEFPDLNRTPPHRVRAALKAAWDYYTYRPLHNRGAAYLAARGIDVTILEAHTRRLEVGHTPLKADGLVTALRAHGFLDDELVDAGLAYRRLGSHHASDFYRQRVLIPLRDQEGQTCGLIGRNIGDPRWPKYKNPPRTHAYDKSVNLYQPLPPPGSPYGQVVIVEGTLDALAIAVAAAKTGKEGLYCPVTQSGRELSDTQIGRILRLHPAAPVLGFDSDAAGRESAFRYALEFARYGRVVAVSTFPPPHDPASWLAERGPRALSAWSSHNRGSWEEAGPIPASAFVAGHLVSTDMSRTQRMRSLVDAANLAIRLPRRTGHLWAQQIARIAGQAAVAEAQEHVTRYDRQSDHGHTSVDLASSRPETEPLTDVGFKSVGRRGIEATIERIANWGRQLPRPGDLVFTRAASAAIHAAGNFDTTFSPACIEEALGRTSQTIASAEAATAPSNAEVIRL